MAVGIYSGTFDPIHEGHILFAQVASEQFGLDTVLITPEPTPRYKTGVSSLDDRLAMVSLATEDADHMEAYQVPAVESHTFKDVLMEVAQKHPDEELYILMGVDVFKHIESWGAREDENGRVSDIGESVGFIVGVDSGLDAPGVQEIAKRAGLNVRILEVPIPGLSSRSIRAAIKNREEPRGLNDTVRTYIDTLELYR